MPYLSEQQLLDDDRGVGAADIPLTHLTSITRAASASLDAYAGFPFDFRWWGGPDPRTPALQVPWERTLRLSVEAAPLRSVQSALLVTTFIAGQESGIEFGPGDILLNGPSGQLQTTSFALTYAGNLNTLAMGYGAIEQPYWRIEYTSGYDAGDLGDPYAMPPIPPTIVAPDGLVFPYPDWLVEACRFEAIRLCGEWMNNDRGMMGLERLTSGPYNYSRPMRRGTKEENPIDPMARHILDGHLEEQITLGVVQ